MLLLLVTEYLHVEGGTLKWPHLTRDIASEPPVGPPAPRGSRLWTHPSARAVSELVEEQETLEGHDTRRESDLQDQ